jgi:hypothetical protein
VNRHTIKVENSVVCCVNKRGFHSYEFSFPQEKTLWTYSVCGIREVYDWLDTQYGVGRWVAV